MENFTRTIPGTDFPDDDSCKRLISLEERELARARHNLVTLKSHQQQEKVRLTRSLHPAIFFVKDEHGYPVKIVMPQVYHEQVGNANVLFPGDWADLPKPSSIGDIEWPPKTMAGLMKADGSEQCVGCEMKLNKDLEFWTTDVARGFDEGDDVKFVDRNGRKKLGRVTKNVSVRQMIMAAVQDGEDVQEVEIPYLAVRVRKADMPTRKEPPQHVATIGNQPQAHCSCDISNWRKYLQAWHKRLELRRIPRTSPDPSPTPASASHRNASPKPPTVASAAHSQPTPTELDPPLSVNAAQVGLFSTRYIPTNHPIGERIGVLKPELSHYDRSNRQIRDRTASPEPHKSKAEVLRYRTSLPIGKLPPADSDMEVPDSVVTCLSDNYAYGNFTRFIRHSCDPNVERHVSRYGGMRMEVFLTCRPIYPDEEVTEDFGIGYLRELGGCGCGSEKCQLPAQRVTSNEGVGAAQDGDIIGLQVGASKASQHIMR